MFLLMKKLLGIVVLSFILSVNILVAKETFELNCKDGVLYEGKRAPEPFGETINFLINIKDYSYVDLNFNTEEISYLIPGKFVDDEKEFYDYMFSSVVAQISIYNSEVGQFKVVTAFRFGEDLYQSTKIKIDNINKQIKNYKLQKNFLDGFYTVSSLGTQKQEYNKFEIIKSLINIVNNTNINDVSTAIYRCNRI